MFWPSLELGIFINQFEMTDNNNLFDNLWQCNLAIEFQPLFRIDVAEQ